MVVTYVKSIWRWTRGEPKVVVASSPYIIFFGIGLFATCRFMSGFLIVSSIVCLSLGSLAFILQDWSFERGLWMASLLFLLIWCPLNFLFVLSPVIDQLRGVGPMPLSMWFDFFVATSLLSVKTRFLWTITLTNYALPRR